MKRAALRVTRTAAVLLAVLLGLVLIWALFNNQIHQILSVRLLISSNHPSEELFEEAARQAPDVVDFLQRCWATGKVTHRQLTAAYLKSNAANHSQWLAGAERLLISCATDEDLSVRELGLAALSQVDNPHLFEVVQAQLDDVDPSVRRLGLDYLRKCDPNRAAPILIRELDDPDLKNVAAAEIGLMRLSGEDFGVRASLAIESNISTDGVQTNSVNVEAIKRGVERRKQWWLEHQKDFASSTNSGSSDARALRSDERRPSAPDFTLHNLEGKSVSLSDFKGKVVLVNFWATWCTACLKEIPDLVALQQKMGDKVAIIGVALDGVPDEDGDMPDEGHESQQKNGTSRLNVRAKVERAVKLRRINYPVLLDPKGLVGGQYNGGELPTTVIFDAEGRVRRRFIGERSLEVFQAMVAEAGKPLTTSQAHL
jgi:thiol-disulfide isomerase/thioredoxin